MNTLRNSLIGSTALVATLLAACGDEARPTGGANAGGSTGAAMNGSTTGAGATDPGAGGSGGGSNGEAVLPACTKKAELSGKITKDTTLTADTCYTLKGITFVEAKATLKIEKGTHILGDKVTMGTLVIKPGAKIDAQGTRTNPIVFTSQAPKGQRAAGDWGGVMLLGKAPVNIPGGVGNVEGITGEGTQYGGTDPNDNSGVLKYVRIEFSGILLSPNNEVNGLTLAGVGAKTEIDYVMVHDTLDDCFEFFGGTVNAKHLVCANNQDDGFDWDNGYKGKLQFIALVQDPLIADDTNGFEGDNDALGSAAEPISEPTIYNATLCGKNQDLAKQQYGMLLRRSTKAHIFNTITTGFEAGIDIRDKLTSIELKNSIFFGNVKTNIAYLETADGADLLKDDDGGIDEIAWFKSSGNQEIDPQLKDCYNPAGSTFTPEKTLTENAATPPDDGFFDKSANYIGAFSADDNWASGRWIDYSRD